MNRRIALSSVLALWMAGVGLAQDEGPVGVRVRVVSRDDGTPRPGVVVHVVPREAALSRLDPTGKWATALDPRVRELRAAKSVRTDPEGFATLPVDAIRLTTMRVFTGAPFESGTAEIDGDQVLLRVVQHEPFSVRAVGADGTPLADFPVALHAGGVDVSVALTDRRGIALLGVPRGFEARLWVAPAGWIGPRDGFPTVATVLAKHGPAQFEVPPFGTFRMAVLRGGEPARSALRVASLWEPTSVSVWAPSTDGPVLGAEFGPMALGQSLRGHIDVAEGGTTFTAAGPTVAGECAVFEFEVDPPRPKLAFRLVGDCLGDVARREVLVQAITSERVVIARVRSDEHGRVVTDFGRQGLPRARLSRVHVDWSRGSVRKDKDTVIPPRSWSASVAVDRTLEDGVLDLGEVELRSMPPVFIGRVVDEAGAPVQGARIEVTAEPPGAEVGGVRVTVFSDLTGGFELTGPVPRDAEGRPLRFTALAAVGEAQSERTPTLAPGATMRLVVPRAAIETARRARDATVEVRVAGVPDTVVDQLLVDLRLASGRPRNMPLRFGAADEDGVRTLRFERVGAGRYTLKIIAHAGVPVLALEDIVVAPDGTVDDDRLENVDLSERMSVASIRVIDQEGVPVAGADVDVRLDSTASRQRTNPQGRAAVVIVPDMDAGFAISAEGHRPQQLLALTDGQVVRLEPAGKIAVRVVGLPDDVPREPLEVWVRGRQGERYTLPHQLQLGAGDVARGALPARGVHSVDLWVSRPTPGGGSRGSRITFGDEPVPIGDGPEFTTEIRLDAAAVERLRRALADRR